METTLTTDPNHMWSQGRWNGTEMLCQERFYLLGSQSIWGDPIYPHGSDSSTSFLLFCIILLIITISSFILKPAGLPTMSQMFGGVVGIGVLFSKNLFNVKSLLHPTVVYLLRTLSILGFVLYSFIFGVETDMRSLRGIGKKDFVLAFAGYFASLAFSYVALKSLNIMEGIEGLLKVIILNAQTFFMVTCSHVNDLGMSNSEIGRMASKASLILDIYGMLTSFLIFNTFLPVKGGDYIVPFMVIGYYIIMFFVCRPLILVILSYTPEGRRMRETHFLAIVLIVLLLAFMGIQVSQPLSVFLFALTIPEEPLTSILRDRLDTMNSSVLLPIFCAMHGFSTDYNTLNKGSFAVELFVMLGVIGKFFGTLLSSKLLRVPFWSAVSLAIIMASKGFLDIVMLGQFVDQKTMTPEHYTVTALHVVICTLGILPVVRYLYEPSKQYSTILRQGVVASADTGSLQALACIHKEDNLPGILRLLEAFHPTEERVFSVIALQVFQLTGRVTLPILAPFHEVQSSAAFRSNLSRCNRVINSLLSIERRTQGAARLQHYIAVSPYATMHNDICNLAHEKNVSLIIIPFHLQWSNDGGVQNFSQSIRDVNKMVLEKAPCSVGLLIDRGDKEVSVLHNGYHIAIFFIGGVDDHEAIAYATLFASHPNIKLTVIWLKSKMSENNTHSFDDYAVLQDFHNKFQDNDRISFQEAVVNDGSETTNAVNAIKDEINLAMVGKYHEPGCTPLLGLTDRWSEYPELGIFGDLLISREYEFSVLVVQEEPHQSTGYDDLIEDFLM